MKKLGILIALVCIAIAGAGLVRRRSSSGGPHADRKEQTTPEGKPVVEEWGEASFPASDPPQSW